MLSCFKFWYTVFPPCKYQTLCLEHQLVIIFYQSVDLFFWLNDEKGPAHDDIFPFFVLPDQMSKLQCFKQGKAANRQIWGAQTRDCLELISWWIDWQLIIWVWHIDYFTNCVSSGDGHSEGDTYLRQPILRSSVCRLKTVGVWKMGKTH